MLLPALANAEWLETDGLGGFAMGTASGIRTRRYHGLLTTATTPPTGRVVLVSGFDAWIETDCGRVALTTQNYRGGVQHPDGASRIESFDIAPWPVWRFRLDGGALIEHELFMPYGHPMVCLRWRIIPPESHSANEAKRLIVRPFLAARDYHSLQHESDRFCFESRVVKSNESSSSSRKVEWQPFEGLPAIVSRSNGDYRHEPDWYRQFLYVNESERGLDCLEDLASPGWLSWDLSRQDAVWLLSSPTNSKRPPGQTHQSSFDSVALEVPTIAHAAAWPAESPSDSCDVLADFTELRTRELDRRQRFASPLHRAADAFVVQRGTGKTIIAGYPWFTDWGRDTFIALRGLCLATGELEAARSILVGWAGTVSDGMLPNRFCDQGETPEFNSVDASLWFVIVVHEFLIECDRRNFVLSEPDRHTLRMAIREILNGYARGTRFGIRLDADGLIAAGQPGVQLTWMDAKVGDWVVTPRIGKPVEVQALWLNALWLELEHAAQWGDSESFDRWQPLFELGRKSFEWKFWNAADGCLFDVVDVDHRPGEVDARFRPNQIFAAGGLPLTLVSSEHAGQIVAAVEEKLWTPLGLRSLASGSPGYCGRYGGSPWQRDAAYHQGTAWAWLLGPFVDAWLKIHAKSRGVRLHRAQPNDGSEHFENVLHGSSIEQVAWNRFIEPLLAHRYQAGYGHISEIADGDRPHTPRGCPFQAWSLGELLRIANSIEFHEATSCGVPVPIL